MHEKLKFSFGHIFAFLALIFIGYVSFTAVTYFLKGNYLIGGIVGIGIAVLLLIMLFWLQLLKSVNQKFEKYIRQERVVLFVFTILCFVSLIPYSHFWTIKKHEEEIVSSFKNAFLTTSSLFDEYNKYFEVRVKSYNNYLQSLDSLDAISSITLQKGMRLQLKPDKYIELDADVKDWVKDSEKGISIWNVFIIGNTNDICNSLISWADLLRKQSSVSFLNEKPEYSSTYDKTQIVRNVVEKLKANESFFTEFKCPVPLAWVTGVIAVFFLYLPWLIQRRSPKSLVTIWGKRKIRKQGGTLSEPTAKVHKKTRSSDLTENDVAIKRDSKVLTMNDDDYGKQKTARAMSLDIDDE